jgi:hypothetical protein
MKDLLTNRDIDSGKKNLWIVLFIYLSIFINSYVFFTNPFEFYLGYLIYLALLPVFLFRYQLNRNMVAIFLILFLTGIFNILIGNNTSALFFKVFTGLVLSYFFYYFVILEFDYNIEQLFIWYLRGCYIIALIGIVQFVSFQVGFTPGYNFKWIFNKWGFIPGGLFGIRVNSVFAEPTYLASTFSAAFFVGIYNLFRREPFGISRFKSAVIVLVYLMSFSGLGQTGIFLALILMSVSFGLTRYVIVIVPTIFILFNFLYNNVSEFRDRFDGLTGLFSGQEFTLGKTHGSSFILYNNFVVSKENFKSNFVFGSGIGSHPVAFDKYSLARNFKVSGFNSNSADANSMFLRLMSETGIFGIAIFIYLIFKGYVKRDPDHDTYHWLVSNGILVMILLNLLRQGHYFLNGFPFFVILYYYNSVSYKNYLYDLYSKEQETTALEEPAQTDSRPTLNP